MTTTRPEPSASNGYHAAHVRLLCESFERLTGQPLLGVSAERALAAFNAPFVLVSHNTAADPIFNYANRQALELFELTWAQMAALPSRKSAEPVERAERERLMHRVRNDGFIDDYAGIRVTSTGRRFRIEQAVVWNLIDDDGKLQGQAATFANWTFL